ncbi:MAG: aminotransferase class IV [Chloroflexi bacterium]|nr:aminotransferase class IV [Chloroflexota bacterium]
MAQEFMTYFNGKLVPDSEVRIHYSDSGLSFGHTVTDSARTFHHRPFKLREHIKRFFHTMRAVRIDPGMSPEAMEHITLEVLEANKPLLAPDQDVWLTQTATGGRLLRSIGKWEFGAPTMIINSAPLDFTAYAHLYDTGVHAVSPSTRHIPPQSLDPKIKHRDRLFMSLAEFEVKEVDPEGFSILLDIYGNLSENKGANFFIVKDGVLRTPTTRNALAGISRATVLELSAQLGIPTAEEDLQPYHVITAEEAFFCSTSYCILPATKYNGYVIGDGQPGPVVKRLQQAWSEMVGVDIVAQAQHRAAALSPSRA